MHRKSPHEAADELIEADAGPRDRGPERFCIVDRTARPREALIRFVLAPDGTVTPDVKGRLPGRGVWVTARAAKIDEAVRRRLFARGFRREVSAPADLAAMVGAQLRAQALGALGLARRAGDVVLGFAKVEGDLKAGRVGFLLHAADAAPDGVRKLSAAARGSVPVSRVFDADELSLALGRSNVIHAAVKSGPRLEALIDRCRFLERYLDGEALPAGDARLTGAATQPEEQDV
ncbi:MAG: RNA-binding protein [Flavobacteriaceae bacterium]